MTADTGLTEKQLSEIRDDVALAATTPEAPRPVRAAVRCARERVADHHAAALLAHVDHLTGLLATAYNRLDAYGTATTRFPRPTSDDPAEARRREVRALLESGRTTQPWEVGRAICPRGYACPDGPFGTFKPTKRGLVPAHRGIGGHICAGAGTPTTPLRLVDPQ